MPSILSPNPNDPRVIRTRQLILDSFAEQLNIMDFNAITVQDITRKATINRATFYAHFPDKYALLESFLSDAFTELVLRKIDDQAALTEETLYTLVAALCDYHESSHHCLKKYDSLALIIEENIKLQLEQLLQRLLSGVDSTADSRTLQTAATLLSWSIYGVTYRWNKEGRHESAAALAGRLVPLMNNGVSLLTPAGGE
ncbi:TetR family transcriptional regulator [Paenibacillus sp. LMG 31459]|jgi:AcrR family transcriptional regulator|uniref:TetR family transcriptional regulator n=1 Tax=Paenibacillus phytohabitans TaxID=2654978 RepID=A0ABX1YB09_9BACL|nr:TetR family transcriptional regulator [Paenibacillus phytohabitans]NOU78148.1 TetR family transcriptional regulator [Paenibacillus phytohabitans]